MEEPDSLDARIEKREFDEATLELAKARIGADPRDDVAWVAAARCYEASGRLSEARTCYRTMLSWGDDMVARNRLKALERRIAARGRAEKILAHDGASMLFTELEAAKERERDREFQVEGRRLLARRERTVPSVCALGAALRHAKDLDGALVVYRHAWQLDPEASSNPMGHIGFAAVLRDLRRYAEAERIYRGVLAVHRGSTHAMLGLAAVYLDRVEIGDSRYGPDADKLIRQAFAHGARGAPINSMFGRLRSLGMG